VNITKHWIMNHLHDMGVVLSSQLDELAIIVIVILLLLRLFQWKAMGKAVIPTIGVYVILKVLLP
jgi:hypothetical protein